MNDQDLVRIPAFQPECIDVVLWNDKQSDEMLILLHFAVNGTIDVTVNPLNRFVDGSSKM
jgi:hypothetical protein